MKQEFFSSRWALIFATIGMAIGAGNIWRFPRLAGQYGGSFLIPWLIFLFLWSIPLLVVEFGIGRKTHKGIIASFTEIIGNKFAWLSGFICFCTSAIMFYYAVVSGWALKYFLSSAFSDKALTQPQDLWNQFTNSYEPIIFQVVSLILVFGILFRGLSKGIEKINILLIPSLFILLIFGAITSLSLPHAEIGLSYLFKLNTNDLLNHKIWLEALSQSAWSTGAGWGLIATLSIYMKEKDDLLSSALYTGIGNNLASILAALAIIPAVFSLAENPQTAEKYLEAGNQGLSFIVIPQLFSKLPFPQVFTTLFFLALFMAAISSLISMLELLTRTFMDFGKKRKEALVISLIIAIVAGIPSAISLDFFSNQDWVWGLGLIINGLFFILLCNIVGNKQFIAEFLGEIGNNKFLAQSFEWMIKLILPIEGLTMLLWWLSKSIEWNPNGWWNPLGVETLGTCVFQWGLLIGILVLANWVWVKRGRISV